MIEFIGTIPLELKVTILACIVLWFKLEYDDKKSKREIWQPERKKD
jgi:hypothetical protein